MASSRKPPSGELIAELGRFLGSLDLRSKRLAVGLSGGVDSVVLLHVLKQHPEFNLSAIHVHHGLSPNAGAWARFCRALCTRWGVPLAVRRVKVAKRGAGLEAAAREARYRAFKNVPCDAVALAHNRDDQAETVLMNLLRGAGVRGASGMAPRNRFDGKMLLRPLLEVPRAAILAYAREQGLQWVEDRRARYFERSEEHTSELQSPCNLVCRLLLEKKKKQKAGTPSYVAVSRYDA